MNKLVIGQLREWDKQYCYDQQFILLGVNDGEYKKYREFDVERYSTLLSE
jgi:hypothetical protein